MGLTRVTSGKLWHDDCSSLDAWDTYAINTATIGVVDDNIQMVGVAANDDICNIIRTDPLPSDGIWVVRTRVQTHNANAGRYNGIAISSADTIPNVETLDIFDGETEPTIHFSGWDQTTKTCCLWPNDVHMDAVNWPYTDFVVDTPYNWEIESIGIGSQSHKARNFSNGFASLLSYATATATRGQNPCWIWFSGNTNTYTNFGTLTIVYVQAMLSLDIAITGLSSGQAVRIYKADGTYLASAVESGGTATLDLRSVEGFDTDSNPATDDGGFNGKFKIFRDNSYAEVVHEYAFTDIWGGDEYEYTVDDFLPESLSSDDAMPIPESNEVVDRNTPIFAGGAPVIDSYTVEE